MSQTIEAKPPVPTGEDLWKRVLAAPLDARVERQFKLLLDACKSAFASCDEDLLERAFRLAYWAHYGVARRSREPYITHPLEVAHILAKDVPFDDTTVAAALLHDVVEDNPETTLPFIEQQFGSDLAKIIDGLTKMERSFENRAVRQAENFRKLVLSMATDLRVILVKFADRLHNMRTISSLSQEKQVKIAMETRDLFAPLAHRFGLFALKNELEDLALKVLEPDEYYFITRSLRDKKREREAYVSRFIHPVRAALAASGLQFEIYGRSKHIYSIYRKMRDQGKSIDQIYDLLAIRIIIEGEGRQGREDCWRAYSIITDSYKPLPERFRDFISMPKGNGYQSLHTTVLGPDAKPVEVQIRTREMHEVAERGVAAHWNYKEGDESGRLSEVDKRFAWVRDLLESPDSDRATEFVQDFARDLSGEEIYLFSPKGDLFILPKGATPIDFAFGVHSEVGLHCSGAKVNDRFVPLSYRLRSGDQVEIVTSKNQWPKPDWMKFVVTQKARSRIRQWLNDRRRTGVRKGKEIWEKKMQKARLEVDETTLNRSAAHLKFPNTQQMFFEIGEGLFNVDELINHLKNGKRHAEGDAAAEETRTSPLQLQHERFLDRAQSGAPALLINGERITDVAITYASCCNPIPGDQVIGFLSRNGGIKIHRTSCRNAPKLLENTDRIIPIEWSRQKDVQFLAALRILGEDRVGIVSDITDIISKNLKTNIRSLSIGSNDGVFEGTIVVDVSDLDQLRRLMERVRRIEGIFGVYRFEE
jgi:GTP diphosphokinase / guanosine-3',5'-bis(diphosphate) 3'-diphosphatase